jgi:hypothetical protein
MFKLLATIALVNLSVSIPTMVHADTYDDFMETKIAEFRSNPSDSSKCKHHKVTTEFKGDIKRIYDLCVLRGKPISFYISTDGTALDSTVYRNGKIAQMALSEFGDGVGFRNGQPVVEWRTGTFGKRGINWKITAQNKAEYLANAAEERRLLLKLFKRYLY